MSRQRSIEKIQASDYVSIGELARLTGCRYSTCPLSSRRKTSPGGSRGKRRSPACRRFRG